MGEEKELERRIIEERKAQYNPEGRGREKKKRRRDTPRKVSSVINGSETENNDRWDAIYECKKREKETEAEDRMFRVLKRYQVLN